MCSGSLFTIIDRLKKRFFKKKIGKFIVVKIIIHMNKILLVEDETNIRDALRDILEINDYEVVEANNGFQGSIKAVKEKPDLIISDINMPEMDGFEMLAALKICMDEDLLPPFIYLTAKVEVINMRRGMALGADDYILKPFDANDLLEAVKVKLQKRKEQENKIASKYRRFISSELHDSIQQLLLASQMGFEGIKVKTSALNKEDQDIYKFALGLLKQGNTDLRNFAHNLADVRKIENIEESLTKMIADLNGAGDIKFNLIVKLNHPINIDFQTHLYRITQEAVNNILKYAEAKEVNTELLSTENEIELTISDNGIGFDAIHISEGLGINIMKRRAEDIGANFQIITEQGHGTTIKLSLKT
jgi:two-component system sensor histidine kinase/response regulator